MNNKKMMYRQLGVAMVEFAIVLPLMIMLLFGITELGRALYQQNSLDKAVNTGARYISRLNGIVSVDLNNQCAQSSGWTTGETRAKELVAYGEGTTPLLPNLDPSKVTVTYNTRTINAADGPETLCVIRVTATVPFVGLFGDTLIPFTNIGSINLHAETEERYIGL